MQYKDLNDYEVIYRIRENDDLALNEMFLKYEPIVISFAKKYFSFVKKFGMEFEDLLQEGRIAVNNAINTFDASSNTLFYTYVSICIERSMMTISRNLSRKKRLAVINNVDSESLILLPDISYEPSLYVFDKFNKECFICYKNMFEIEDSCIFELKYNGFSYKEISDLLDIPLKLVESRLCKIRKTLQFIRSKF